MSCTDRHKDKARRELAHIHERMNDARTGVFKKGWREVGERDQRGEAKS